MPDPTEDKPESSLDFFNSSIDEEIGAFQPEEQEEPDEPEAPNEDDE